MDDDSARQTDSRGRRRFLGIVGSGTAGLLLGTGVGGARPPSGAGPPEDRGGPPSDAGDPSSDARNGVGPCTCDSCPDGTFCGKVEGPPEPGRTYSFSDDGETFSVTVDSVERKADGEITCFECSTDDRVEQVCVKGGPDTATYDDSPTQAVLCAPTNPGGQQAGISNVSFCGAPGAEPVACYQVDLVVGGVIEDFGTEGPYGDRRLEDFAVCSDGTVTTPIDASGSVTARSCTVQWQGLDYDADSNTTSAEVTLVSADSEPCTVSLAGYRLPDGERTFDPGSLDDQTLRDGDTVELTEGESATLGIDLDG